MYVTKYSSLTPFFHEMLFSVFEVFIITLPFSASYEKFSFVKSSPSVFPFVASVFVAITLTDVGFTLFMLGTVSSIFVVFIGKALSLNV